MNTNSPYTAPSYRAKSFHCPFCNTFADQHWGNPNKIVHYPANSQNINYGSDNGFSICRCSCCEKFSVWFDHKLIFPRSVTAPPCNPDLPDEIKIDYEEARLILQDSPRGAAALLRLALQKLCSHLGEEGKNINKDISELVKKGLPVIIQQALDIVRVVGNNAVHPGQMDLRDDIETANKLFGLVNLIVEVMITQPKHIAALYEEVVPDNLREAIKKRDDS
jgi:hypothetical protein